MVNFNTLSLYFAMLDELLHIGTAAVGAIANADPSSTALQKVEAHLNAFTNTVDNVIPTIEAAGTAVVNVINTVKPPQV